MLRLKLTVIVYEHYLLCVLKFKYYLCCHAFRVQCNRDYILMPNFLPYLLLLMM